MENTNTSKSLYPLLPKARVSFRVVVWAAVTGMAIAVPVCYLALAAPIPLPDASEIAKTAHHIASMPPGLWFLVAVVVAPLWEEFLFRGVVLQLCRRYMRQWVAVLVVTTIFALGHIRVSPQNVIVAFFIGLYMAWLMIRSGSLYPGIVGHAGANFFWNFVFKYVPGVSDDAGRELLVQPLVLLILIGSIVAFVVGIKILRAEFDRAAEKAAAA